MNTKRKKSGRKLLGFLLTLVLAVGLMPGMSLTALAYDGNPYASLVNTTTTVTFNGKPWYIIADNSTAVDAGTVTLLAAKSLGTSKFHDSSNKYSTSTIKTILDNMTATGGSFAGVASAINTVSVKGSESDTEVESKLWLLSVDEAKNVPNNVRKFSTEWWLRSPGGDSKAAFVYSGSGNVYYDGSAVTSKLGVRPALKLDLSSVIFDSESKEFSLKPSHTHSFTYAASDATITATCANTDGNCTLDDGTEQHNHAVTLTLSATDASYTGSAYTGASLTDTTAWTGAGLTAPTIEYAGRGSTSYTKSTTAPTNAGTYTASITVDTDKTATADFTISPIALTIDTATATDRTYDKDSTAVTISAVTFKDSSSGSVTLTKDTDYTVTGAMTDANAGNDKTVNVTVTLKNANYNLAKNTATTTVNIGKAGAQTIADVTDTLLYTATSVSESVAGKMPDDAGTLTYSKGTATTTGSVTVSNFDVNAASGAVTATLSGGAVGDTVTLPVTISSTNYADSTANVVITLTAKGTQTITADDVTVSYGDTGKSVSASVTDPTTGGGDISYAVKTGSEDYIGVDATTGALTIKKVGTAIVVVTAAETDTYAQATKEVTVTINKGEGGGTPSANTLVYNGSAQELVTAGVAEGGTMMYALGENASTAPEETAFTASIPTGVDAKTYYVWYMVKGDANHNDTKPACVEASIAKRELTVTADAKSKTVGEADPALTYTVTGLVGTDVMSGALSRDAGEAAGTYQITQGTLTAGDNYAITFIPAVLTIQEAPSSGGGGGGGGVYYGGGTVSSQPQAPYSQVIGATATSYGDSSPERIHNIELACEKLNGIIVEPGEVFSFNEAIGSLTADSGFEIAPVYPGDEATAVMGGGVSQVASTLYASSLFGLLETIERSNHEYAVPFAQAGVDADVSNPAEGGGLDLKFRNSRSEPIKIVVTSKVDEAKKLREITVELRSVLSNSDYMPVRFDNSKSGEKDGVLFADVLDPTRPGYRIVLDHEEQSFTDANGSGIRTLTHRKILDAGGWLVKDEILNARLPDGSYAMDTYYTKG